MYEQLTYTQVTTEYSVYNIPGKRGHQAYVMSYSLQNP